MGQAERSGTLPVTPPLHPTVSTGRDPHQASHYAHPGLAPGCWPGHRFAHGIRPWGTRSEVGGGLRRRGFTPAGVTSPKAGRGQGGDRGEQSLGVETLVICLKGQPCSAFRTFPVS